MFFFTEPDIAIEITKRKKKEVKDNLPLVMLVVILYMNEETAPGEWEEVKTVAGKYFFHTMKKAKNFVPQAMISFHNSF